jgi:hypothetical protein
VKRDNYLLICGVILVGLGAMFILLTRMVVAQFLVNVEPTPLVLSLERNIGAALCAMGLVNVLGAKTNDAIALKAIIVGTLTVLVLTAALDVMAVVAGIFAPIGWGVVVFKALLSAGYLYQLSSVGRG